MPKVPKPQLQPKRSHKASSLRALKFLYETYPVYLLVLFGAVVPIAMQALTARIGLSYYIVGEENDQQRGIHTDNMVGVLTIVVASATLAATSLELKQFSLILFSCQEIVNFVCDNSVRSSSLRKSFHTWEQPNLFHTDNPFEGVDFDRATEYIKERAGWGDEWAAEEAKEQKKLFSEWADKTAKLVKDNTQEPLFFPGINVSSCSNKYGKGQRVTLHYGKHTDDGIVYRESRDAIVTEERSFDNQGWWDGESWRKAINWELTKLSNIELGSQSSGGYIAHKFLAVKAENEPFPNERPISASLKPDNPFKNAALALGSMASFTGMKSAIISIVTIFLLDAVDGAFSGFVDAYRPKFSTKVQRYVPLVGLWASNVLASVPINTLRFGWAYDERDESTVNPGVVATLFLVMLAVYVRLHDEASEDVFPLRSKVTVGIIGMSILVLFTGIGNPTAMFRCEPPNLWEFLGEERIELKWRALLGLTMGLVTLKIFSIHAMLISSQLAKIANAKK